MKAVHSMSTSTFTDLISSEEHQFLKLFKPTFAQSSKSAPISMLPSTDKEYTREIGKMAYTGNRLPSADKEDAKESDKKVSKEKKIKTRTNLVRPPWK